MFKSVPTFPTYPTNPNSDNTSDIRSATDYYAFGWEKVGRSFSGDGYRNGFNGKELDRETGENDFGARSYNSKIGRWQIRDPLSSKYPALSNYCFVGNMPNIAVDPDGKDVKYVLNIIDKKGKNHEVATKIVETNQIITHTSENSLNGGQDFAVVNVIKILTIDLRKVDGNNISTSDIKPDFSNPNDNYEQNLAGYLSAKILPYKGSRGKQDDGWQLTSEFAKTMDGPKTDSKYNPKTINIDLIVAAAGAINKAPGNVKEDLGIADGVGLVKEVKDHFGDMLSENSKKKLDKAIKGSEGGKVCPSCSVKDMDLGHIDKNNGKGTYNKIDANGNSKK